MNNPRLKNRETLDLLKKDWQRQMAEMGTS